jgi:phosphoribosylanthranilate isomerase
MKVKICGITNKEDALCAAELGADALGFIFVPSSLRYITPSAAKDIIGKLPPFVTSVGVFADSPSEEILSIIQQTGITCLQLHGNESPKQCSVYQVPVIKAFRVGKNFHFSSMQQFEVSAFLLDKYVDGSLGGTGKTFNWKIAVQAKKYGQIILAGGLHPENIIEAIRTVQPYAVDVNSGVESEQGKKDKEKLKRLFMNIQKAQKSEEIKE